jgi:hypothetical protein
VASQRGAMLHILMVGYKDISHIIWFGNVHNQMI